MFGQAATDPAVVATAPANAAEASGMRTFSIVPRLEIDQTFTSNSRLTSVEPRADSVTQISPGVLVTSQGGRAKGYLDYTATGLAYARNTSSNQIQNALDARFKVEAIESRGFVDLNANISQQAVSAFGTQSADQSSVNGNRTEVRTYTVSPYLRGELGNVAQYEARVSYASMRNKTQSTADNRTGTASLQLGDTVAARVLNWSAVTSRQRIDYTEGRAITDDRLRANATLRVVPELRITVIEGRETNNYVSADKETHTTPGLGVEWRPSERTHVSAEAEKRFFGSSHSIVAEYRSARSAISYVDTKDITTGVNQPGAGSLGTAYDIFFSQFASQQPDPVLRAKLVNDFLQTNGISPTSRLLSGSLASAPTVQRLQQLALAWLGVRDTVTLTASSAAARRLDAVGPAADDFANGNNVRTRSLSVDIAHRLTPLSALNLNAILARASGNLADQSTRLRSLSLLWNTRLATDATLGIGVRRSLFDSPRQPYNESAALAYFRVTF